MQAFEAVKKLLKLANMGCGGSHPAAGVLLATYNASSYPLDVTSLCVLDDEYLTAAMDVIMLRVNHRMEPHEVMPNGSAVFEKLAEDWQELHINNRTIDQGWQEPLAGDAFKLQGI